MLIPSPSRLERFCSDLQAIWPDAFDEPAAKLGIAVSGGPDSVALLLLGAAALPGRIEVATVDHGLREQSAAEAADVAALCARLGVDHVTLPVRVLEGNVQSEARTARYAALSEWARDRGLAAISTAHHADDQAETLVMRLNRASGVAGLAGARARGPAPGGRVEVLRPLLHWRRAELGQIVQASGVMPAQDPSNADPRFDRVRVRAALAQVDWLDVTAMAQSAGHIADADAALDWSAAMEYRQMVKKEPFGLIYRPYAPRAIALRVVARIVRELDGAEPRGGAIARLFDALVEGRPTSIGQLVVRPVSAGWSFSKAPVRAVRKRD